MRMFSIFWRALMKKNKKTYVLRPLFNLTYVAFNAASTDFFKLETLIAIGALFKYVISSTYQLISSSDNSTYLFLSKKILPRSLGIR